MNEHHVAEPVRHRLATGTGGHDHLVGFYETDGFLISSVTQFLAPALAAEEAAVVVATPEHGRRYEEALAIGGLDVDAARRHGQLVTLDANAVLARLSVAGEFVPQRLSGVLAPTFAEAGRGGRPVRLVGEMSSLLWQAEQVSEACALEEANRKLVAAGPLTMLCTYPNRSVDTEARTLAFLTVCEQHTGVIPSEAYSALPDLDGRLRRIALLQQENLVARAERGTLLREQSELRAALTDLQERDRGRTRAFARFAEQLRAAAGESSILLGELEAGGGVPAESTEGLIRSLHDHVTQLQALLDDASA